MLFLKSKHTEGGQEMRNIFHGFLFVLAIATSLFVLFGTNYVDVATRVIVDIVFEIVDFSDPFFKMFAYPLAALAMLVAAILPFVLCFLVVLPFAEITTTREERIRARGADEMALLRASRRRSAELLEISRSSILPPPNRTYLNQTRRPVDGRGNRRH